MKPKKKKNIKHKPFFTFYKIKLNLFEIKRESANHKKWPLFLRVAKLFGKLIFNWFTIGV